MEILSSLPKASLLIMDEPTAVLTPQEAQNLMEFIRNFAAQGNAVIFITHKLKEVMSVADRIIVMRAVRFVAMLRSETNEVELSKLMIGKDLEQVGRRAAKQSSLRNPG